MITSPPPLRCFQKAMKYQWSFSWLYIVDLIGPHVILKAFFASYLFYLNENWLLPHKHNIQSLLLISLIHCICLSMLLNLYLTEDRNTVKTKRMQSKVEFIAQKRLVYLPKMQSLLKCIYPAYSHSVPNKLKKVGGWWLKGYWFDCLNRTLKIKWLKSWIKHRNYFWYCIPNN